MRVSNYRRDLKVYILLNISGKCGLQNAAGPQNYDYAHLPVEYGLCRTKMFAVSLLLETIFVLYIRRRYSRVRIVLVCIRGFGRLFAFFSLIFSFHDFILVLPFSPLAWRYIVGCSLPSGFSPDIRLPPSL